MTTSSRRARQSEPPTSSGGPVTGDTVSGAGALPPACAKPVEEWAAQQHPDCAAQPSQVVDGLLERQPDVVIAVVLLDAQPHPITVEAQRTHPAAPQRRRQPRRQQVDHLAMVAVDVL